jgi:hypothetical protein
VAANRAAPLSSASGGPPAQLTPRPWALDMPSWDDLGVAWADGEAVLEGGGEVVLGHEVGEGEEGEALAERARVGHAASQLGRAAAAPVQAPQAAALATHAAHSVLTYVGTDIVYIPCVARFSWRGLRQARASTSRSHGSQGS